MLMKLMAMTAALIPTVATAQASGYCRNQCDIEFYRNMQSCQNYMGDSGRYNSCRDYAYMQRSRCEQSCKG